MKKIGLSILSLATLLAFTSCEETAKQVDDSYPTDGLKVDKQQNVLVVETTGAWCQFCPNGSEMLKTASIVYEGRIIPLAAHTGDEIEGNPATLLNDNYPTTGVPNFYVMNENSGQDINANIDKNLNPAELPTFAIKHKVVITDTSYNVYPLIEVLNGSLNETFFIQSYSVLDAVLAKDYGNGMDLNQVSSVPLIKTGSGSTPSKWGQDAVVVNGKAQVKSGDLYYHEHALWSMDERFSDWGFPLAEFNPFGNEYIEGDIIGSKYTPIELSIEKTNIAPWQTSMSFVTIIWKLRTDGTGGYDYINGYMSHSDEH